MVNYDGDAETVPGGKDSGVFDFDMDDLNLHEEVGSSFSDLFSGGGFYAEGSQKKGVFEYDHSYADYKKMLGEDAKVASLEAALTAPVMSAGWSLDKPDDDDGQTDFVEQFLRAPHHSGGMRSNFRTVIGQATSARSFRKAFFEKTYKAGTGIFEGQVVYDDIAFRPYDTCKIWVDGKTGRFKGFRQRVVHKETDEQYRFDERQLIDFPPPYCWVHVNGQHRDPIGGVSDLEVPLWCYKTKKRVLWMWAIFLSTQGEPRTVVKGGQSAEVAKKLRQLKGGGIISAPDDVAIDILESAGTGAQAFKDFMAYMDAQILASRLAGFLDLTSPTQSTGSYALSADQSSFFKKSEERFRMEMEQSITDNVVADLVAINFGPEASVPAFKFDPFETTGLEQAIALLTPRLSELPFEFISHLAKKVGTVLEIPEEDLNRMMEEAAEVAEEKQAMSLQQEQQMVEQGGVMGAMGKVNKVVDEVAKKTGSKPPFGNPMLKGGMKKPPVA